MKSIDFLNINRSKDPRRVNLDGRVLVAHQAEFMPWLGFISKATMGDMFLILDDTQYKKRYFENRNKIKYKNKEGWLWLNVPVKNSDGLLNMLDVEVLNNQWVNKHLKAIKSSYSRCEHFKEIYPYFEEIYKSFDVTDLVSINISFIKLAFELFNIDVPLLRVSELKEDGVDISGKSTNLVVSLCKSVNADVLVAGISGQDYLDMDIITKSNIKVVFQKFTHPTYNQMHGDFLPYLSFMDLLFNYGKEESIKILGKSDYIC